MGIVDDELIKNSPVTNDSNYWDRLSRDSVNLCSLWIVALEMVFSNVTLLFFPFVLLKKEYIKDN